MKTSNKLLVGLLGVIMTVILSFLIAARMNAEVASSEQRAQDIHGDVQGNGRLGLDQRSLSSFHSVALHSNMDIEIGSTFEQVEVEAEDNIFDNIITIIDEGTLHIHWKKGEWVNSTLPIKIRIPVGEISTITLNSNGFITVRDTIFSDSLKLNIHGNGDLVLYAKAEYVGANIYGNGNIEIAGSADHLKLVSHGSGDLLGFDLDLQTANIHTEGNGRANVNVAQSITGTTHGSGHIKFRGEANTAEFNARNGRLIHLDE